MRNTLDVLVVEDEMLLLMDIEALIEDSGHRVVGGAVSLSDVERLSETIDPQLAFVDVHLANGSSGFEVSRFVGKRWPNALIVFVTANIAKIPSDFCGAHGVIGKPFSSAGIVSVLNYIAEGVFDPPPFGPRPASFIASPMLESRWAS